MAEPDLLIEAGFSDAKLARSVRQVIDKYKAAGVAAEKAFKDSTDKVHDSSAVRAHMRELDRLKSKYDPIYTATKRYEREVEDLNQALKLGAIGSAQYAAETKKLNTQFGQTAGIIGAASEATTKATGSNRAWGSQLQQVGFQVGDFATQVGAGTSATQALGQQLPQLLGAFGTFGALAGAGAAIMIPLGAALIKVALDSESLEDRMKALAKSTDAMSAAADTATIPVDQLRQKYGDLADEIARANDANATFTAIVARQNIASTAKATAGTLINLPVANQQFLPGDVRAIGQQDRVVASLAKSMKISADEAAKFVIAVRALENAKGPEDVAAASSELLKIYTSLPDAVKRYGSQVANLTTLNQEAARQVEKQRNEVSRLLATYDKTTTELGQLANDLASAEKARTEAAQKGKIEEVALWDKLIARIKSAIFETKAAAAESDRLFNTFAERQKQAYQQYAATRAEGPAWRANDAMSAAKEVVKKYEGYISSARWDENANRAGYGSSTVTLSDGTIQKLTAGQTINAADAERDLERRIGGYFDEQRAAMGKGWDNLSADQIAALASVQHNYGSLPERIRPALATGDASAIAQALAGLAMDYTKSERAAGKQGLGTKPMNYDRRMGEASAFGDVTAYQRMSEQELDATQEQAAALKKETDERKRKRDELVKWGEQLSANLLTEQQTAALNQQRNAKVAEINASSMSDSQKAAAIAEVNAEMERQRTIFMLLEDAKKRGVDLDAQMTNSTMTYRDAILALGDAQKARSIADQQAAAASEQVKQAQEFAAQQTQALKDGIVDAIVEGRNFADVLANVAQALAKAALQAALFGQGPMSGGGGGGLLGSIFSGFGGGVRGNDALSAGLRATGAFGGFRAAGGPVSPNSSYIVGEKGPELFTPGAVGQIVPNHKLGGAGGQMDVQVGVTVDDSGNLQAYVKSIAQGSAAAAIGQYDRQLPSRMQQAAANPRKR